MINEPLTQPGALLQHFKGTKMRVLHRALDSATCKDVIIYVHLDDGRIWVRPVEEFFQMVTWPDGERRTRFTLVEAP